MSASTIPAGWKAHAALLASGGVLKAFPGLESEAWRLAGNEPVWLGREGMPSHPRVVCVGEALPGRIDPARLAAVDDGVALPRGLARPAIAAAALGLATRVREIGAPVGLAALLTGAPLDFPFAPAAGTVRALAEAAGRDDPQAAFAPAFALLGLGPGLTPSGDDLVGALLFARRLLADAPAWQSTAWRLAALSTSRTHRLSASLFADLLAGHGHGALHRLALALARGGDPLPPARELVAIGHSSGWDMLAGLLFGLAGPAPLCARFDPNP